MGADLPLPLLLPPWAQVSGAARVPLPAHQVFALLTHPSNERIFRHLQTCNARWHSRAGRAGQSSPSVSFDKKSGNHCCRRRLALCALHAPRCVPPSCPRRPSPAVHALSHMLLPLGPTGREVLEDGGPGGVTVVESEHVATWRLLMFSGTLQTRQVE